MTKTGYGDLPITVKGNRAVIDKASQGQQSSVIPTGNVPQGCDAARPYRSKTEALYSGYLSALKHIGQIQDYRYEAIRLILAKSTSYCPDFLVVPKTGPLQLIEVKGWMREDANVKLKVAAAQFPMFQFVLVSRVKGQWIERRIP